MAFENGSGRESGNRGTTDNSGRERPGTYTGGAVPRLDQMPQSQQAIQAAEDAKFKARLDALAETLRSQRDSDLLAGRKRGEEIFTPGALGRVSEGRAGEIADLIQQRKDLLGGFTPNEMNGFRDQNLGQFNAEASSQMRALKAAQAQNGIRGAAAVVGQSRLNADSLQKQAGLERDVFLKGADARRTALDNYDKTLTGARDEEMGRQKFNIGQGNKERYGQLATELGWGSLGAGERGGAMTLLAGQDATKAATAAANSQAQPSGTFYICTALLERGFLSQREMYGLHQLLLKMYRKHPVFSWWYHQHAPKMVSIADQQDFNWQGLRSDHLEIVLNYIKLGNWDLAWDHYVNLVYFMMSSIGYVPFPNATPNWLDVAYAQVRLHLIPKLYFLLWRSSQRNLKRAFN